MMHSAEANWDDWEGMEEKAKTAAAKAGEVHDSEPENSVGQLSGPLFTFDDLEAGMPVYHRDKKGWIVAVGNEVNPMVGARHIRIAFKDRDKDQMIHENTVNRYLKKQKNLWVDFQGLTENGGQ